MAMIFPTDYARTAEERNTRRLRHGKPWTEDELQRLAELFAQGNNLKQMTCALERPADGTISKLCHLGLIGYDSVRNRYEITQRGERAIFINKPKEETMNETKAPASASPVIETKIFIQGEDATYLSDEQIFNKIAKLESKVDDLKKIRNRPKKLQVQIDGLEADIVKLVEYVDTRS